MKALFERETLARNLTRGGADRAPVTEADLAALPAPAARYLAYAGIVGHPRDWSFRAELTGRFRRKPTESWKTVRSLQYNTADPAVARLFYMRLPIFGIPVQGRDTYVAGRGRLLIRPLDLFTVQDLQGPEMNLGELVTWVNDAVLFAPSMLLSPRTAWRAIDDTSFGITVTDAENTVSAEIALNPDGSVRDFQTDDRWITNPGAPPRRCRWSTPIEGWQRNGRRAFPTAGKAVWLLSEGAFNYADLAMTADAFAFNVDPTGRPA